MTAEDLHNSTLQNFALTQLQHKSPKRRENHCKLNIKREFLE